MSWINQYTYNIKQYEMIEILQWPMKSRPIVEKKCKTESRHDNVIYCKSEQVRVGKLSGKFLTLCDGLHALQVSI